MFRRDPISPPLPQETAAAGDETVLELALAVSPALVHAQKVIKEHEAAVTGIANPGADAAYHDALHVFDKHGASGTRTESKTGPCRTRFSRN